MFFLSCCGFLYFSGVLPMFLLYVSAFRSRTRFGKCLLMPGPRFCGEECLTLKPVPRKRQQKTLSGLAFISVLIVVLGSWRHGCCFRVLLFSPLFFSLSFLLSLFWGSARVLLLVLFCFVPAGPDLSEAGPMLCITCFMFFLAFFLLSLPGSALALALSLLLSRSLSLSLFLSLFLLHALRKTSAD